MILEFNTEQIEVLKKFNLDFDFTGDLSDEQIVEIEDEAMDYYLAEGRISEDVPNQVGLICESIVDLIHDSED